MSFEQGTATTSKHGQRVPRRREETDRRRDHLARYLMVGVLGTLAFSSAVLVFFTSAALLQAQTPSAATGIEGTWQGTLVVPNGPHLRTVVKIVKDNNGTLKSTFYSIDQEGAGLPATSTTFSGGELRIAIERINLTYTGKMAADGKSINGSASQGSPLPLVLERTTPATEWTIPEAPKPVPPMDPNANPSFDVATIKPSKPDAQGKLFVVDRAGKFRTLNFTLGEMISTAYGVQAKQVVNAPEWVWTEKFDVQAQPDTPGSPSRAQLMGEVQRLMADRFQLKFHRDKKELPALVITVDKSGSKLKPSEGDPKGLPGLFFGGVGVLRVNNATISDFTSLMQSAVLDRPVVDHSGLTGRYDFTLKWTPDEAQLAQMGMKAPATEAADAPPNLFTALPEELGLRMESAKTPVEVLVIDKVEKPSDN